MSLSIAGERNIVLEMAEHSARLLVISETCYFARTVLAFGAWGPARERHEERAHHARCVALGLAASFRDDADALAAVGLAGLARDLARRSGREIGEARAEFCRRRGFHPGLGRLVEPACWGVRHP